MIKEAIQYLVGLASSPNDRVVRVLDSVGNDRVLVINNEGDSKEIKPVIARAEEALRVNTLTGLIDYVKSNVERVHCEFYLHIFDEKTVILKGLLDPEGKRETLITANAIIPNFEYGRFLEAEQLIIAFQSKFTDTGDRDIVLKVVGNVKEENVRKTGDNGVSQVVTIKTGIASADDVLVPNPVTLAPYRTFLEVVQPASDFIFRMKDGPVGAIFEADGGAWRNQAIVNVREFLTVELAAELEAGRITIIA